MLAVGLKSGNQAVLLVVKKYWQQQRGGGEGGGGHYVIMISSAAMALQRRVARTLQLSTKMCLFKLQCEIRSKPLT